MEDLITVLFIIIGGILVFGFLDAKEVSQDDEDF